MPGLSPPGRVMLETTIRPCGPYSLRGSLAAASDCTRRFADGALLVAFDVGGAPARAAVRELPDGRLAIRLEAAAPEAALDRLRFLLACDDDIAPFLALARDDELLRDVVPGREGRRALRTGTVAHALMRALAGQLIESREARSIENRLIRACTAGPVEGLRQPPTAAGFAALAPARVAGLGLAPRRAAALVRICRDLDLERLAAHPTSAVASRLVREPAIGPWSIGVIVLYGLGRFDHGLVGDLSLVRLCSALAGRRAEAAETAALLSPYGPWAGLASLHLAAHPLAHPQRRDEARRSSGRHRV